MWPRYERRIPPLEFLRFPHIYNERYGACSLLRSIRSGPQIVVPNQAPRALNLPERPGTIASAPTDMPPPDRFPAPSQFLCLGIPTLNAPGRPTGAHTLWLSEK